MKNSTSNNALAPKNCPVEMSSEAITRRIREVSELNQLGLSLVKATPMKAPSEEFKTINDDQDASFGSCG